jgi:hypothetical protein
MPFGLKNAPSEFQRIMNDIFNAYENKSTRRKTAGNSLQNNPKWSSLDITCSSII